MAKKAVVKETNNKFLETIDNLNKKYGVGSVLALDSKSGGDYDVISTGSIGFDHITLGVGGFVKGKLYELMGWEGTGKSTICGHAAAECQKAGGTVLYIDGEHAVDKNYFKKLGVDTTKMLIAQPSCGEEGFNIAMDMINTGEIDLVIIDSDSSLIPKKMLDGDVNYGNITKLKAIKNKMSPPYRKSEFEIVYGVGIDKLDEMMALLNEFELGRKYGKTMTVDGTKYDLEEFKQLVVDNPEFYDELREKIIAKINESDLPVEEIEVEEEVVPAAPCSNHGLFDEEGL